MLGFEHLLVIFQNILPSEIPSGGPGKGLKYTVGNVSVTTEMEDCDDLTVECFLCHQRGDHQATDCPPAASNVEYLKQKFEDFQQENAEEDKANPAKKYRFA